MSREEFEEKYSVEVLQVIIDQAANNVMLASYILDKYKMGDNLLGVNIESLERAVENTEALMDDLLIELQIRTDESKNNTDTIQP